MGSLFASDLFSFFLVLDKVEPWAGKISMRITGWKLPPRSIYDCYFYTLLKTNFGDFRVPMWDHSAVLHDRETMDDEDLRRELKSGVRGGKRKGNSFIGNQWLDNADDDTYLRWVEGKGTFPLVSFLRGVENASSESSRKGDDDGRTPRVLEDLLGTLALAYRLPHNPHRGFAIRQNTQPGLEARCSLNRAHVMFLMRRLDSTPEVRRPASEEPTTSQQFSRCIQKIFPTLIA